MRNKVLLISVTVMLVIGLVIGGCAPKPASPPAPAPPAPAPAPAPAPTPPTPEPFALEMFSHKLGGSGYIVTFALSELINKESKWLRSVCVESTGSTENVQLMIRYPEKTDRMFGYIPNSTAIMARKGLPPFEETPYKDLRALMLTTRWSQLFMSIDPNIKKPEDLIGKRVGFGTKGSAYADAFFSVLKYGYGIEYDDMKVSHLSMAGQADAAIDGVIDVATKAGMAFGTEPVDFVPNPSCEKLLTSRECYVVEISEEAVWKGMEGWGVPIPPIRIAAQTIGKTSIPESWGHTMDSGYMVSKDVPDHVVTEILRIVWENIDVFGTFHASLKAMTRENIASMGMPRELFHPAAIKFYEEHGITKIGLD